MIEYKQSGISLYDTFDQSIILIRFQKKIYEKQSRDAQEFCLLITFFSIKLA